MTEARQTTSLLAVAFAARCILGCAGAVAPPPAPPAAPVVAVEAPQPHPEEWNLFPDPLTGRVEVYHNGQAVGSVTGEEKEDPPIPQPHKGDEVDEP